jgi:hypothetical protein
MILKNLPHAELSLDQICLAVRDPIDSSEFGPDATGGCPRNIDEPESIHPNLLDYLCQNYALVHEL